MHIVLDRLAGAFLRGLEQRADVHIKTQVGKGGSHHLGAAVMPVLSELGDHDPWPAALRLGEGGNVGFEGVPVFHGVCVAVVGIVSGGVNARDLVRVGAVTAKGLLQRVAHFTDRGTQAHGGNAEFKQITLMPRSKTQGIQGSSHSGRVALSADLLEALNLPLAHRHVVNVARLDGVLRLELVFVDADDHIAPRINARLLLGRCRLNFQFGPAAVHCTGHAAQGIHFLDDLPGSFRHVMGQLFHHVTTRPGVDHAGDMGLFLNNELRVEGNPGRELGGQRNGLVKAVGVQALRAAKHSGHGLDGGAHHIVVRVLLGQAPAAGLAMGPQHQALGRLGVKTFHDAAPQQTRGPHLGNFEVKVHADCPEKGQPSGKLIHIQTGGYGRFHILLAVGQGEGQLQRLVGAGLLHVVARDRNRVEPWHVARGVGNDVANNAHRGCWRINIGVAHHELFEDVVLDRARELRLAHALLFGRHHIASQHRQHGAVHGH